MFRSGVGGYCRIREGILEEAASTLILQKAQEFTRSRGEGGQAREQHEPGLQAGKVWRGRGG